MSEAQRSKLQGLPVELLYEIQLYSVSSCLPYLSRFFFGIFIESPTSFRAQFLLASCVNSISTPMRAVDVLSKALRYRLCTTSVLDQLWTRMEILSQYDGSLIIPYDPDSYHNIFELPRRLFRYLAPREGGRKWGATGEPLPFLQHILGKGKSFPSPDPNSHQGYALTRAVYARHMPLIRLLLDLGASPACKEGLAIKVAIKQKDLGIVKFLVGRGDRDGLVVVDESMLNLALKCNAKDIIRYLACEKGIMPNLQYFMSLSDTFQ